MAGGAIGRRSMVGAAGLLLNARGVHAASRRPRVQIDTRHGVIVVELAVDRAPLTAANFLRYVDARKYDGGSFYRAVHDPGAWADGTIVGEPGANARPFAPIAHESTTTTGLRHGEGTISLGRFAPGTATSTFFICLGAETYLDAHPGGKGDNLGYAAFGQVIQGMAAVRAIHGLHASRAAPFPEQRGEWLAPPAPILSMKRSG